MLGQVANGIIDMVKNVSRADDIRCRAVQSLLQQRKQMSKDRQFSHRHIITYCKLFNCYCKMLLLDIAYYGLLLQMHVDNKHSIPLDFTTS